MEGTGVLSGVGAIPAELPYLPHDVLASIFLLLGVKEIGRCACVSRAFAQVAMDERKVWQPFAEANWGAKTKLKRWLRKKKVQETIPIPGVFFPHSYRMLSVMLSELDPMVGLWQAKGDDQQPQGALYKIEWVKDGLLCSQLSSGHQSLEIIGDEIIKFGPSTIATGKVVDDTHLIIRDYTNCFVQSSCSGTALAAASVAVCGISDSMEEGSPPRSFESEMQKFMNMNVLAKGRRKSKKGNATRAPVLLPECHYMSRVEPPKPTRNTSLAGLWKGMYYMHGLEIIKVDYDFSGSHARIIATKITGDRNVPAGERTWEASAKTMYDYADAEFPGYEHEIESKKILACHAGWGRVADVGFINPRCLPGQLLELEDDIIRFAFSNIGFVEYTRMEEGSFHT